MPDNEAIVKPTTRPASILRAPEFRRLYFARVLSTAGDNLADVALAVFAYAASHNNPLAYGSVMAASYAAPVLVGFLASGWIDRWHKQRLMVALDLARAVLVSSIPVVGQLWWAVVVVLAAQALNSYYMPAVRAVTPETVPGDRLLAANAALQNGVSAVQIPAYLVATVVVSRLGPTPAFLLDALSFLGAALAVARMRLRGQAWRPSETAAAARGFLEQFLEGLRYQRATRVVLRLLGVYMVSGVGLYGLNVVMAAWVVRVAHEPLSALGVAFSALAGGSLVGSLAVGRRPLDRRGYRRAIAAGFLVMAGSLAALLVVRDYAVLLAAVFVSGIGNAWAVVPLVTWIQEIVPPAMRGRVMVTRRMGIGVAAVVGSLLTGGLVVPLGVQPVLAGLLACLALAGGLTWSRWIGDDAHA